MPRVTTLLESFCYAYIVVSWLKSGEIVVWKRGKRSPFFQVQAYSGVVIAGS